MATIWHRIRRQLGFSGGATGDLSSLTARATRDPLTTLDWEVRLVEAGVGERWAPMIAIRLERLHQELGADSTEALLRAAVASHEAHAESQARFARNMKEAREVERLLGAFSGELEKLDEVLDVLSTYARRMRSQPAGRARTTLH